MNIKAKIKSALLFLIHGKPVVCTTKIATLQTNELLKNRCALITGGTSGIGLAIAKTFLNAGANVIITGRNKERLDRVVDSINQPNRIFALVIDNSKVESIEEGWLNALSIVKDHQLGVIDILVNNAGVNGGHLPNATESDYDIVMDTNLKGVFFFSQIAGKYMVERKVKGNILNVASSSSLRPAVSAYTISKWGIRGLTMGLARSLSKYGITVNGIAPGQTLTPMMTNDIDSNSNIAKTDIPLGRWILPEEIANGALFLVSDLGRAVVGDILYMTGGAALLSYEDVSYDIF